MNFRKNFIILIAILGFTFCEGSFARSRIEETPYSLGELIERYGFSDKHSRNALEKLFHLTFIVPKDKSFKEVFPQRETKNEAIDDFIDMLEKVQERFIIRTQQQERWAVQTPEYMRQNKHEFVESLKILEFIDPIKPKDFSADVLCILGATKSAIARRVNYAVHLMKLGLRPKYIILLTGERYLDVKVDGNEIELSSLAKKLGLKDYRDLTEKNIFEELYNRSNLPKYEIPTVIINTPRKDLNRPTTQTIMLKLVNWLTEHKDMNNILFISSQPHIRYQEAVIESILDMYDCEVKFEVVGPSVADFSNVKAGLEGAGSFIWAKSLQILSGLDMSDISEETRKKLERLYPENSLGREILSKFMN